MRFPKNRQQKKAAVVFEEYAMGDKTLPPKRSPCFRVCEDRTEAGVLSRELQRANGRPFAVVEFVAAVPW